jgi:hypothetical protein
MPLRGASIEIGEEVTDLGGTIGSGGVVRIGAGVFGADTGVGAGETTLATAFVP